MQDPLISIAMVTWNGGDVLIECMKSIHANTDLNKKPYEVILADNCSTDGSIERVKRRFPNTKIIRYNRNHMFAKPMNDAVNMAAAPFIFLMNNDMLIDKLSFSTLIYHINSSSDIGAVAPKLMNKDGSLQISCRRFPSISNLLISGLGLDLLFPAYSWKMKTSEHKSISCVDQPMMSALLVKRECWEDVGPLDERFPLYFNDVDWCYRAKKQDWKILFVPDTWAIHYEAWSGRKLGAKQALLSAKGLYTFFRKHHMKHKLSPEMPLIIALSFGLAIRVYAKQVMRRGASPP